MAMEKLSRITILGFGNQAKAWAMNLRDSGVEVFIALRKMSPSLDTAKGMGLKTILYDQVPLPTQEVAMLTPDETHCNILNTLQRLNDNELTIIYAHGYSMYAERLNVHFPQFKHLLLAPKAIASELRFRFETKENLTAFYSLEYIGQAYYEVLEDFASSLGINYLYPTNFEEETKADLFSEQSLLCSLLPYGINEAYKTLVQGGYSSELAFFECFYESKLILDTIFKLGPHKFFDMISPNALLGSQIGRDLLFDTHFKQKLEQLLSDIENHHFQQAIKTTDISAIKKQVSQFWLKQELNETFHHLKESL